MFCRALPSWFYRSYPPLSRHSVTQYIHSSVPVFFFNLTLRYPKLAMSRQGLHKMVGSFALQWVYSRHHTSHLTLCLPVIKQPLPFQPSIDSSLPLFRAEPHHPRTSSRHQLPAATQNASSGLVCTRCTRGCLSSSL